MYCGTHHESGAIAPINDNEDVRASRVVEALTEACRVMHQNGFPVGDVSQVIDRLRKDYKITE